MTERKASIRVLSFLLALCMFVGLMPLNAFAEEATEATEAIQETAEPVATEEPVETEGDTAPSEETTEATEDTQPEEVAVTGIVLDQTALEVGVGAEPVQLTATVIPENATEQTVTWTSSEPGVASVVDGLVTFGYMGEAVITATVGEFTATCTVVVGEGEATTYEGVTYVLAGSDYQADSGDAAGTTNINNIIAAIKADGIEYMDGFLFAGDYSVGSTKTSNVTALKNTILNAGLGLTEDAMVLIQGNHDNSAVYGGTEAGLVGSVLDTSGAHDAEEYGVFVINEEDYGWKGGSQTKVQQIAETLKNYLNAKRNAGYTKPIFVVSHLPLNYNMRTKNDGDGMYANYIFDVLNEAGNAGLNIIFMFGHDHSNGWDDYLGGAAIYLKKGDKINIAQSSQTTFKEETLAFTYMNAGYVGYYRNVNTGAETDLTMTVFEITDTAVTVRRYSAAGLHNLKSVGVTNSYKGESGYSPNTAVYASPQTITLNKDITPAGEEIENPDNGNTGSGSTERTYTRVTSTSQLVSGDQYLIFYNGSHFMLPEVVEKSDGSVRKGFDIESTSICGPDTITGDYTAKEWTLTSSGNGWLLGNGTQYAKLTNTSNYKVTATLENSGDVFTIGGSANAFTFSNGTYVFNYNDRGLINGYDSNAATFYIYRMTDAGSTSGPTVDTEGGDWVTITEPTQAGTRYVYELDTDGVDTGVEYLIVANSYPKALSAAASSNNAVDIEISGNYAYANSDTYGWTFTSYSDGVYYIRLNNSTYLRLNDNALGSSNSTGSSRRWTVSSNNNGSYDIVRNNYNLRWSNSNGVFQASSSNEGPVRLYKYLKTETTTAKEGIWGKISGELTYTVAAGTSKEDAIAMVKNGIDILYHNGDANAAKTFPDDGEGMTWTMDPSYDGVTPGEYAVTIAYNGVTLGVAKVIVPAVAISGYEVNPMSATVRQGASQSLLTGAKITVTLENGKYYTVPVTISMLSKDGKPVSTAEAGELTGLTVTYNGVAVTNEFTLHVLGRSVNNYPEYPDEGAVKVNKTATGIDFQSSGVAQVEVSASGVPVKKGADVVIVIDTSSSMRDNNVGNTGKTRIQVLSESLKQMLLQFQQPDGETGMVADIDVAIIDFNGYFPSTAGDFDKISFTNSYRDNADYAKVFTGTNAGDYIKNVGVSAANFVDVSTLNASTIASYFTNNNCQSGTNYDGALENAYILLAAKQAANGNEQRDAYVIFLSDGAPFRYNGYNNGSSKDTYGAWNNYLSGIWTKDEFAAEYAANAYTYFYNGNGTNHPHLFAEAIKGTQGELYQVVRRSAAGNDPAYMDTVSGLGATIYSIGFGLADDGTETGKKVSVATQQELIEVISSGSEYSYPNVQSANELVTAFTQIATAINYAASNARMVDQMGDGFDLQMAVREYKSEGSSVVDSSITPKIEIISYDIYTRQDYLDDQCTEAQIGDRKGSSSLMEVVRFSADGKKAYSNQIDADGDGIVGWTESVVDGVTTYTFDEDDNILADGTKAGYVKGVIYAKTFLYNTNTEDVTVTGVNIPTGSTAGNLTTGSTSVLPSEAFYWKMGTVQTSELAMRYYVYLTGSMEGTRDGGSYPTNEYATLYYDNYLGNPCYKDTVSPVMAWKEANVSYAFYLVDENGNIIVNQTTGQTGSFANRIAVTKPVVYETVLLNSDEEVSSIDIASLGVLPEGYTLYDYDGTDGATYTVTISSNKTGSWQITSVKDPATTYVTQFDPNDASAYSNATSVNTTGHDYTHTVVWFAVVWKVQALPDAVVVDYGLPVDISVLANDMFGEHGKLAGIGAYSDSLNLEGHDATMADGFGVNYTGEYGTAKADTATGTVRYTPSNMKMDGYEKFAYAVNYTGSQNAGYYYDTITVIPATTIYYEDSFVNYRSQTYNKGWVAHSGGDHALWTFKANADITQSEDRPGKYSLTDANNIYGYDGVYSVQNAFSQNGYAMATVDYDNSAIAEFDFCGTGFDVISMTNSDTGTIYVRVYNVEEDGVYETEDALKSYVVDTYYGYKSALYNVTYTYTEGAWVKTVGEAAAADAEAKYVTFPSEAAEGDTLTGIEYQYVPATSSSNAVYQVPVMKIKDLPYGQYHAEIRVIYDPIFDHTEAESNYVFYLDAIRIYDPANDGASDGDKDTTIENAYKADGEGWPQYFELRNNLLKVKDFDDLANNVLPSNNKMTGLVFIDGNSSLNDGCIADYISYGPNNEVYLAPGQRVAFMLDLSNYVVNGESIVDNIHIGIKSADGKTAYYTITNIAGNGNTETGVNAGDFYGETTKLISTSTDMYYDLTGWKNDIIVISNTSDRHADDGDGVISLTNIKITFTQDPNATNSAEDNGDGTNGDVDTGSVLYMTPAAATLSLRAMRAPVVEEEPEVTEPEVTEPEVTEPEVTEPVVTEPEVTEPEVTEPEVTEPEATDPEVTEPEVTEPEEEVKVFVPKTFRVVVGNDTVKVGKTVTVTVITSTDVVALSVNGEAVSRYKENRGLRIRTWTVKIEADEVGQLVIDTIGYNAEGIATETVTNTVNVTDKRGSFLEELFDWLFG